MTRVLLDQGLPRSAVASLRQAGWDVVHVYDLDMSQATDRFGGYRQCHGTLLARGATLTSHTLLKHLPLSVREAPEKSSQAFISPAAALSALL